MKSQRPLNEQDLKVLNAALAPIQKRQRYQTRVLIVWSALAVVVSAIVYPRMDTPSDRWLLFGTALVYILIGVWSFLETSSQNRRQRIGIDFVKAQNSVTSIRVRSTEYIELPETEDEGVFYLFQLEDRKVLSFGGQEFYPSKSFPSDDFEIVLAKGPRSEWVLGETYNFGKKIKPLRKITGADKSRLMSSPGYPDPEGFSIVDGTLTEVAPLESSSRKES